MLGIALLWHKKNLSPREALSSRGKAVSILDVQMFIFFLTWILDQHPAKPLTPWLTHSSFKYVDPLKPHWLRAIMSVQEICPFFALIYSVFILPFNYTLCPLISELSPTLHASFILGAMIDPRHNNKNGSN